MSDPSPIQESSREVRYDPSIFDTPFASLPNPKRVWLGTPSSELEGIGRQNYTSSAASQSWQDWRLTNNAGRLSLLTPDVVSAAAALEIKTGKRVGLGWDMKKLEYSQFGRQKCGHTIISLNGPGGSGWGACFDDAYNMNPRGCLLLFFIFNRVHFNLSTLIRSLGWYDFCAYLECLEWFSRTLTQVHRCLIGANYLNQNKVVSGMVFATTHNPATPRTLHPLKTVCSTVVRPRMRSWMRRTIGSDFNTGLERVSQVSTNCT